jgi:hypothetical protein
MTAGSSPEMAAHGDEPPSSLETRVAHIARVYDYWLGGKDNFAADRAAGDRAILAFPGIVASARANRAFLARAVQYLAGDAGLRQFLDIGTGLPSMSNTHEVAQAVAPQSRIVYVDNDPIVLTHARALLAGRPEGSTDYVDADLRDPRQILADAARFLDYRQPVAVMLMAILQHLDDVDEPHQIVAALMDAMPPGSHLTISHPAGDIEPEQMAAMAAELNRLTAERVVLRDRAQVTRFFVGLNLVEPGVVPASNWRSRTEVGAARPAAVWVGVARKT